MQRILSHGDLESLFIDRTSLYCMREDEIIEDLWCIPAGSKSYLLPVGAANGRFVILADSLKQLYVLQKKNGCVSWNRDSASLLIQMRSEKAPTVVLFDEIEETEESLAIFVADRFGGVTRHRINITLGSVESSTIILGHVSIITHMCLAEGRLITADRDEKIRITSTTKPYPIEAFLLGHTEYIAAICTVKASGSGVHIVSVAGDGIVKVWKNSREADCSSQEKNLLDTFVLDGNLIGRSVRAERIIGSATAKADGEEAEQEEVEEFDQIIIEPNSIVSFGNQTVLVSFDRQSKLLCLRVTPELKLELVKTLEIPSPVISMASSQSSCLLLCEDGSIHSLSQLPELELVKVSRSDPVEDVESLWKGGMRKDCHGLFAKKLKRKRTAPGAPAGDVDVNSDIDSE